MSSRGIQTEAGVSGPLPDRAVLIAAEKVRMQYRNMPTAFIGSAIISSLMGVALEKGVGAIVLYVHAALFMHGDDSLHFITGVMMVVYLSLMTPFALRV